MTGKFTTRFAAGFLAFSLVAGCAAYASPTLIGRDPSRREAEARPSGRAQAGELLLTRGLPLDVASPRSSVTAQLWRSEKTYPPDEVFESLAQAFRAPEKVKRLVLLKEDPEMKHLPARLGTLVNLEVLELACLEKLEDLPTELGRLRKLEELVIDNGNGCAMNISVPRSIGQLVNLRVLRLYGALDPRGTGPGDTNGPTKNLPATLANLQRLEELDLGRNGIRFVPQQIAALRQLKKLGLEYNNVREVPAFVGNLSNLEELSLNSSGGVRLPQSLTKVKGLQVRMGNNKLTLRDQRSLRNRFPNIVFFFENEFDDNSANEKVAEPKPKTRRGRR